MTIMYLSTKATTACRDSIGFCKPIVCEQVSIQRVKCGPGILCFAEYIEVQLDLCCLFHLNPVLLIIPHVDPHGVVGRCGRRVVLMGTIVSQAVFGCAIAFAPDIYSFLVLRFAIALVITGVFQIAFVLGIILVLLRLVDQKNCTMLWIFACRNVRFLLDCTRSGPHA